MVCLEELLVVMTNGLKIVKIHTRNMAAFMNKSAKTTTRLSRHSLSLQESDGVVFLMSWAAVLLKHENIIIIIIKEQIKVT